MNLLKRILLNHIKSLIAFTMSLSVSIFATFDSSTKTYPILTIMALTLIGWVIIYPFVRIYYYINNKINTSMLFKDRKPKHTLIKTFSDKIILLIFITVFIFSIVNILLHIFKTKDTYIVGNSYQSLLESFLIYSTTCLILGIVYLSIFTYYCIHNYRNNMIYWGFLKLWITPIINWVSIIGVMLTVMSMIHRTMSSSFCYNYFTMFIYFMTPTCIMLIPMRVRYIFYDHINNSLFKNRVIKIINQTLYNLNNFKRHSKNFHKQSRRFGIHTAKFQNKINKC